MNPEYIVLGGWLWKLWGKKIGLWYAHGYVPWSLKIAAKFVNVIFTSTKSGCRIKSEKIQVVGQGIDAEKFKRQKSKVKSPSQNLKFRVTSVGRISPVKDYMTLINAIEVFKKEELVNLQVDIVGAPGLRSDVSYLKELENIINSKGLKDIIKFTGSVPNKDIAQVLQGRDAFVNMGLTGSLDKAILEAMACGLPILTCNEALAEVLGDYQERLMYPKGDFKKLAEKIKWLMGMSQEERQKIGLDLRIIVEKNHSEEKLIDKILQLYYG
jgi:glycosyltransferase involved in cell wall biosynthesis